MPDVVPVEVEYGGWFAEGASWMKPYCQEQKDGHGLKACLEKKNVDN